MNRPLLHRTTLALLLAASFGAARADAATTTLASVAADRASTEALVSNEVRDAVARLIDSGAFGDVAPESIALTVATPAERVVNLGLLVDSRAEARNGLPVLGTLAGGDAQALGLRAGDVLVAVNGTKLAGLGRADDGTAVAVGLLKREVDALREGGTLAVTVARDGGTLELSQRVTPRYIPAMRLELGEGALVASTAPVALSRHLAASTAAAPGDGCGRISVFHIAPRSENLYPAKVLAIDGEIPGPANQDTYRVAPGPHEVEVAENIDDQDLPSTYSRARRHKSKVFTIDVRPGTTYMVASRLDEDRQREVISGAYWEPVVWKEIEEPCR